MPPRSKRPSIKDIDCNFSSEEISRFKSHLRINPSSGCHEWTGCRQKSGKRKQHNYGIAYIQGAQLNAHKLAMMMHLGSHVPDGAWVLHRCDNPPCCNPQHLYLGTPLDNCHDMMARGRSANGNSGDKISDAQVHEMLATGLWVTRLAKRYGYSFRTINAAFARVGVKIPKAPGRLSDERVREIASLGLGSFVEIAKVCGVHADTIRFRFKKLGLTVSKRVPTNRLADARVREMAASGLPTITAMSKQFGHCRKTIRHSFDRLGIPAPDGRKAKNTNPTNPTN